MILVLNRMNGWRLGASLAAAALAAALSIATAKDVDQASGASLMAATGIEIMLEGAQQGVKAQLEESGGGYSASAIDYASDAFAPSALAKAIADDLQALPQSTRSAVGAFFASPLGARLSKLERAIQDQLNSLDGPTSKAILHEGGALKDDEARGPLTMAVRRESGARSVAETLLRATTHALLLAAGDLDGLAEPDQKVDAMLNSTVELIDQFDDSAYAYGFRFVAEDDLRSYSKFLTSADGAAFVEAAVASVRKRVAAASQDLERRLEAPSRKSKKG